MREAKALSSNHIRFAWAFAASDAISTKISDTDPYNMTITITCDGLTENNCYSGMALLNTVTVTFEI